MTANEFLVSVYERASAAAGLILVGAVVLPLVGTAMAWIGKGGKTDSDGRLIASLLVGSGITAFVLEIVLLVFVRSFLKQDVLEADLLLLIAPIVYLAVAVAAIRRVFPLSELGSVRQAVDLGGFVLVCWGIIWLFGKFRWGVIFFGSLVQLGLIMIVGALLLYRLYKRAFKKGS